MAFNIKMGLVSNGYELIHGKTNIHLYNPVALCTGQMMMVTITADTVVMCPIGKLNTVQQTHIDQFLYRAVDRGSSQTWLYLSYLLPEIINREIGPANSKFYQSICNELSWARTPLAHLVESCANFVCYQVCLSFLLSLTRSHRDMFAGRMW